MIDYKAFETAVKEIVAEDRWLHILPAVPDGLRSRFLSAIKAGIGMPYAFDLVLVSKSMTDSAFEQKLRDITIR
ncbi:MAG TPA: hypothetical protein VGD89_00755 [Flavipsychrobacter sp.]